MTFQPRDPNFRDRVRASFARSSAIDAVGQLGLSDRVCYVLDHGLDYHYLMSKIGVANEILADPAFHLVGAKQTLDVPLHLPLARQHEGIEDTAKNADLLAVGRLRSNNGSAIQGILARCSRIHLNFSSVV